MYDLLDPGANWCPDCGEPRGVCQCTDYDCYYCGGTGLHGDGFHDCPVCMADPGDDLDEDDWTDRDYEYIVGIEIDGEGYQLFVAVPDDDEEF